jgi:hypothetical protein
MAWSSSYLESIRAEISAISRQEPGSVKQHGLGDGAIRVDLRADQEWRAAELYRRHGDAISLTVGRFPYPPDRPLTSREQLLKAGREQNPPRPKVTLSIPGVAARLELLTPEVRSGEDGRGRIVVVNEGPDSIDLDTGQPLAGWIADMSTGERLGGATGFAAGTGWQVSLKPGKSGEITMYFGTASGRADRGYAIPPGRYLVQTDIPLYDYPPEPDQGPRVLSVAPAPLTITRTV